MSFRRPGPIESKKSVGLSLVVFIAVRHMRKKSVNRC